MTPDEQTEWDLELVEAAMYDFRIRLDGEERASTLSAWDRLKESIKGNVKREQSLTDIINERGIELETLVNEIQMTIECCWAPGDRDREPDTQRLVELARLARLGALLEGADEAIVLGCPPENDESHNCDEIGCGQAHVLYRKGSI